MTGRLFSWYNQAEPEMRGPQERREARRREPPDGPRRKGGAVAVKLDNFKPRPWLRWTASPSVAMRGDKSRGTLRRSRACPWDGPRRKGGAGEGRKDAADMRRRFIVRGHRWRGGPVDGTSEGAFHIKPAVRWRGRRAGYPPVHFPRHNRR